MSFDWFKFSPSHYKMGRIQRQSAQVKSDFIDLLCVYWTKQGKISYEDAVFDCPSIDELIRGGVVKKDGNEIYIDFLDEQLDLTQRISKKRSNAGKVGANAKQMLANAKQTKADKTRQDKTRTDKTRQDMSESFEQFWNLYSYKVGDKQELQKKWGRLTDDDRAAIFQHVPKYVRSTPDKKFRKHPATYLNQKSWNDEIVHQPTIKTGISSFTQPM